MASSSTCGCTQWLLRPPPPPSSSSSPSSLPNLPILSPIRGRLPYPLSSSSRLLSTMAAPRNNSNPITSKKKKRTNRMLMVKRKKKWSCPGLRRRLWTLWSSLGLWHRPFLAREWVAAPSHGFSLFPWPMLVNKNAMLCKSIDEVFLNGRDEELQSALNGLMQKLVQLHLYYRRWHARVQCSTASIFLLCIACCYGSKVIDGFSREEIFRKYIRYALNEKPFNPEMVATLIQFRKASLLDDSQVAEILNEISRRIVRDKGPVVMDMSGYSEKGFKRKLAVQALFGKVFYLSELPEFCSRDSSLVIKEIFGVTDEDAEKIRMHTLSEAGAVDSLEKMMDTSDTEDSSEDDSNTPSPNA
ncbi:hypothetical protein CK203_075480 [Vitis vinifera]|uniref:Armadillo-like repeats domain-containing protein n=1 Tax=Vitis vinifera TaxID=29760 RepID=A0A438EU87_VITVI|nr:hypothetical protein CK203_075480 [Vitis vinifera]